MYYNWKENTNTEELKVVCNLIKNGEIVIFPTETVYGIGANAFDEKAIGKIFMAKGRPSDNPLIVHIADKQKIYEIAKDITEVEQKLIDHFMPGPFTLILKKTAKIPNIVSAGLDTVGIRMPDNVIARGIITFSGVPIAAPSANVSGKPSGTMVEDIRRELEGKVSAIVDGGESQIGLESTVVKVIDEIPCILRPGAITPEQIEEVIGIVDFGNGIFTPVEEDEKVESPGVKHKHYAPNKPAELVYAEDEKDLIFGINRMIKELKGDVVVLGFDEHKEQIIVSEHRFIRLGSKDNFKEIAQNIYSALRKSDELLGELVIIEGVKREGLGIAIMNRLLRSCGYNYWEF